MLILYFTLVIKSSLNYKTGSLKLFTCPHNQSFSVSCQTVAEIRKQKALSLELADLLGRQANPKRRVLYLAGLRQLDTS